MNKTTLAVLAAVIFILAGGAITIAIARGYQIDITKKEVTSTGILVATSDPDGAEVLINGKLTTATNNTINLTPGKYTVKIQKDGYTPWEKQIEIKREEVIKTNAFLFPSLADLRPLTYTGAIYPVLSPDKTKIVYGISSASANIRGVDGNGVWIIDMGKSFIPSPILTSDSRQIFRNSSLLSLSKAIFSWSPDEKQILANNYLLDTDRNNDNPTLLATTSALFDNWKIIRNARIESQMIKLPASIKIVLASNAGQLEFSPDESKVLYTATASATLPKYLTTYLPGTNPTPEQRNIKVGNTYVYDLKEDRNYQVDKCSWFPSSRHLLCVNQNQIGVTEYDGTNKAVVFNGQFNQKAVFVWPNWSKIIILTSLGTTSGTGENLYTINLR